MPRIRTIKPDAFVSEALASVPLSAERTFYGLLVNADDAGRMRDRPAVLHGAIWPCRPSHTTQNLRSDIDRLTTAGVVCRYQSLGQNLLHLVSWDRHQSINKPTPSLLPPCPVHGPSRYDSPAQLTKWSDARIYPTSATPPVDEAEPPNTAHRGGQPSTNVSTRKPKGRARRPAATSAARSTTPVMPVAPVPPEPVRRPRAVLLHSGGEPSGAFRCRTRNYQQTQRRSSGRHLAGA